MSDSVQQHQQPPITSPPRRRADVIINSGDVATALGRCSESCRNTPNTARRLEPHHHALLESGSQSAKSSPLPHRRLDKLEGVIRDNRFSGNGGTCAMCSSPLSNRRMSAAANRLRQEGDGCETPLMHRRQRLDSDCGCGSSGIRKQKQFPASPAKSILGEPGCFSSPIHRSINSVPPSGFITGSPAKSIIGEPGVFASPARSLCASPCEEQITADTDNITQSLQPDQTVVSGWLKFRDNKRWKIRWGVVTKLSPAADCLHLQLYRDSKDRYKQGQTKASLSLQHFLGVESGFTLDKESNTIAIICQDVIVVLAFDTRERLIQWQVKISNNLGDDIQYLILVSSAPSKAKLSTGPARMHVQDQRFCLTTGVPPRLAGLWEIGHLRRYGVVDNRFCFEGGSRCGKGEGLYVLVTDQGDEITHTLKLAAQGKLAAKRRPVARKLSAMDSPRKISSARNGDIGTVPEDDGMNGSCICRTPYWPSQESRDLDSNYGCGDTASVSEIHDCINDIDSFPRSNMTMERCMSCISKLGAPSMSRSSTATGGAQTPGTNVPHPAWSIACSDNHQHTNAHQAKQNTGTDRMSLCSHGSSSGNSDYSVPRLATTQGQAGSSESWYERIPSPHLCSNNRASSPCQCCPPRPPKSQAHRPAVAPTNTICNGPKPQMPLPITAPLHIGPYENYDVPRLAPITAEPTNYTENYDTPRRIHECLARDVNCNHTSTGIERYENYDTPAAVTRNMCGCLPIVAKKENNDNMPANCTCHRVMSWADNWIPTLPYCRRGNGIENTGMAGVQINRVKLSGEGKMPVMQPSGDLAIYATVDMSKKLNRRKGCDCENNSPNGMDDETSSSTTSNYINIEPSALREELGIMNSNNENIMKDDGNNDQTNYINLEFAQSLENYENAKEVLQRAGIQPEDILSPDDYHHVICKKCGHLSAKSQDDLSMDGSSIERDDKRRENGEEQTTKPVEENYMMMEPDSNQKNLQTNFPGYLPMSPAAPATSVIAAPLAPSPVTAPPLPSKTEYLKARMTARLLIGEKSASNPSLIGPPIVDRSRKLRTEGDRVPGSAMMLLHCSGGSPYTRKLLMDNSDLLPAARKRSSSADSSRFLDGGDLETAEFDSTETLRKSSLNQLTEGRRSSSPCIHQETEPCQDESCYIKTNNEVTNHGITETEAEDEISASTNQSQSHSGSQNSHSQSQSQSVNIRRSASVPCKAQNRDSSSSNDSGVSTGSLRQRGGDFADFELPLTTSMSSRRHRHILPPTACVHASLPRRSKSFDPLRELSFQFQRIKIPEKSTSAEAEIPICPPKGKAGFASPGGEATSIAGGPPYIDSRSTSSGTSDMSDYIETLSLSSHSSSDTPEGLRLIRQATTTLRPRSGKEYHNIDRSILCLTQQQQQLSATGAIVQTVDVPVKILTNGRSSVLSTCPSANYANITPVPENAESPSPGYQSGGSSQDVHHADHFMFKN